LSELLTTWRPLLKLSLSGPIVEASKQQFFWLTVNDLDYFIWSARARGPAKLYSTVKQ
jgi:hypothetical protein